jgi:hypothetical protein
MDSWARINSPVCRYVRIKIEKISHIQEQFGTKIWKDPTRVAIHRLAITRVMIAPVQLSVLSAFFCTLSIYISQEAINELQEILKKCGKATLLKDFLV